MLAEGRRPHFSVVNAAREEDHHPIYPTQRPTPRQIGRSFYGRTLFFCRHGCIPKNPVESVKIFVDTFDTVRPEGVSTGAATLWVQISLKYCG